MSPRSSSSWFFLCVLIYMYIPSLAFSARLHTLDRSPAHSTTFIYTVTSVELKSVCVAAISCFFRLIVSRRTSTLLGNSLASASLSHLVKKVSGLTGVLSQHAQGPITTIAAVLDSLFDPHNKVCAPILSYTPSLTDCYSHAVFIR